MSNAIASLVFSPLVPWPLIAVFAAIAAGLILFGLWQRASGIAWRALALGIGLAALANPSVVEEERRRTKDLAVVVIDESPSQSIGQRGAMRDAAEAELRARLAQFDDLDVRFVRAGRTDGAATLGEDGTRLFAALQAAIADTPRERFAGAILITDGQVHDAPADAAARRFGGPLHVLLTGAPDERDRRIVVEQAPSFGIVGGEVMLTVKVEETGAAPTGVGVTLRNLDGETSAHRFVIGRPQAVPFRLRHGGANILEIEVEAGDNELTLLNNRAVVVVNGVRDRLRVLLVSGEPHAGERVWRNLLKSDPSVDLVHFTILRPPEKQDGTPIRELSLIAFPIRELFELKLAEFDLIIFDRYRRRGILPTNYIENIANYVRDGGALLESSGPAFASPLSLYRSPLASVLPGRPTGQVHLAGFHPTLTAPGRRHPVTADLPGATDGKPAWGRWLRMVDVEATSGTTLMSGHFERPLLLLDRVGKGRVAQVLSDHAWLWARGYEGGGPQAELLRRLAHWLMKEPDLEEDSLRAELRGGRLEVTRRSLEPDDRPVDVTKPDGTSERIALTESGGGHAAGALVVQQPGLYRLSDGKRMAVAAVGAINPREFADLRATPEVLAPIAQASGGVVRWLAQGGVPDIRRVAAGRDAYGRNWLGLIAHRDHVVTGVRQIALLPAIAVLMLLLGGLLLAWRREGR